MTTPTPIISIIVVCLAMGALPLYGESKQVFPVEYGTTKPGHYRNDYFGFSLSFPRSWTAVQQRIPHQFQKPGGDILVRDGVLKREVVEADQRNTHTLLNITNRLDPFPDYVPSIAIVAEGIHEGAPFHTAEGYIAHTAKFLSAIRSPKYRIVKAARPVSLGGRQFYRATFEGTRADFTGRQFYYARLARGFALSIVVSGGDQEQLARADSVLHAIRFENSK